MAEQDKVRQESQTRRTLEEEKGFLAYIGLGMNKNTNKPFFASVREAFETWGRGCSLQHPPLTELLHKLNYR